MKKKLSIYTHCHGDIKMTPLRQAVLSILSSSKKPLSAYEILDKLKKIRSNAEPPTVYRVLDFFVAEKIVHRIESQKTYVRCSQSEHNDLQHHEAVLLFCMACHKIIEYPGKEVTHSLKIFAAENKLKIDDALIEIKGICQACHSNK